jgi:hypothetical protein
MICNFSEYVIDQGYSVMTCESGIVLGLAIIVFLLTSLFFVFIIKR